MKGQLIMWQYLQGLPNNLSVLIVVIGIVGIVIISLKGTAVFRWGKNLVGLGGAKIPADSEDPEKNKTPATTPGTTPGTPSTVVIKPAKRGCGDCILILIGEREKYELNIRKTYNRILKQQMNFVEQKLSDMQTMFVTDFIEVMNKMNGRSNEDSYETQYKLYYGLLRDSLFMVKDEFRRSFKENGFFELDDKDFSTYIKNKATSLISVLTQHIRNLYPTRGVIVTADQIIEIYDDNLTNLQEILFAIYVNAKQVVMETDREIENLKAQYSKWVDEFVN